MIDYKIFAFLCLYFHPWWGDTSSCLWRGLSNSGGYSVFFPFYKTLCSLLTLLPHTTSLLLLYLITQGWCDFIWTWLESCKPWCHVVLERDWQKQFCCGWNDGRDLKNILIFTLDRAANFRLKFHLEFLQNHVFISPFPPTVCLSCSLRFLVPHES